MFKYPEQPDMGSEDEFTGPFRHWGYSETRTGQVDTRAASRSAHHTKASLSKCKKCKKRILVCQASQHAEGSGWRLCDVPCGCGPKYYPSTAKTAEPLETTEYASSHPQYESPPPPDEESTSYEAPVGSEVADAPVKNPAFVEITKSGDYLQFHNHHRETLMAEDGSPSVWSGSTASTTPSSSNGSYNPTTPASPPNPSVINQDDDPLIPPITDVYRIFSDGKATWKSLLDQASRLPPGLWPADALDPYLTLVDVPSLPDQLPRSDLLYGRPLWELPLDIRGMECEDHLPSSDTTTFAHGRRVSFRLQIKDPIRCDICTDAASCALGSGAETTGSLAVLVMCWSYIFSVRLLEMQGRQVQYSMDRLWPDTSQRQSEHMVDLDLQGASPALVRWLCAILSPKMGWQARDLKRLPPWATSFKTGIQLGIKASVPAVDIRLPPSSYEATELLIELCRLFNLKANLTEASGLESMPPYKASFLATLMLPFYGFMKLQPRLPPPLLTRPGRNGTFNSSHEQSIRSCLGDLCYFMTLSIHPPSVGSILWSIFWQPDVDCNLVGPWLASVLDTLEPVIKQKQVEVIVKVFLSRRPRIAIWWIALFLLGDLAVLDWIQRYMTTLEEKYGFGSLSPPDPMISVWTGSKQSFLDSGKESIYTEISHLVSKADLLRCRFDRKLQDSATSALSWRPFGYIEKGQVEPELWPQLETKYMRKYNSFTWYLGKKSTSDKGFRIRTSRNVKNVPDDLEMRTSGEYSEGNRQAMNVLPSKESTCRMMFFLVEDTIGGRDWANADIPVRREQLRWLYDWEGLDNIEVGSVGPVEEPARPASWFLYEWIKGKYDKD
ncbi:hypothetical protein F66182_10491 [Fusarium sp. NRRL 66182]|nr:hypothetical protein F66182_10491 [Fusarium sp. NRRL 66182]